MPVFKVFDVKMYKRLTKYMRQKTVLKLRFFYVQRLSNV